MTPYTFIASDSGPSVRIRVTLRRNISSSWDHHRNYPLMPIHKSVGHFQSPARNSGRNTAAVHSHTDATSATTAAFEHTYTNFVPSLGTNIRVSFSTIRGHEQGETSWFLSPNFPSLALSPFFSFPSSPAPFFSAAIFVSGQLISRRRRGTII